VIARPDWIGRKNDIGRPSWNGTGRKKDRVADVLIPTTSPIKGYAVVCVRVGNSASGLQTKRENVARCDFGVSLLRRTPTSGVQL